MKSHRTDGVSLTFGVIFLVILAWYLAAGAVRMNLPQVGWFVAGGLILLGLGGLIGALRGSRSAPPAPEPALVEGGSQLSDADRAPVAEQLKAALDEGRLEFTDYNERLQQAYAATTYEELERALTGL